MYDRGMTLDIGNKLRDYYGVNVIPMDMLPVDEEDISDVNDNMYWNYGRKILAAARIVGRHPNLHIIFLTNFKCGPDSYIKHFVTKASGKPYLTLQFDGHGNDAGYITRCEAYLDSKGALRWWAKAGKKVEYPSRGRENIEEQAV
jgi:predicted nucleotide-binding protein (sugar kinase/HSP70/actin superfamily)